MSDLMRKAMLAFDELAKVDPLAASAVALQVLVENSEGADLVELVQAAQRIVNEGFRITVDEGDES